MGFGEFESNVRNIPKNANYFSKKYTKAVLFTQK